jgi:hypothetical protein
VIDGDNTDRDYVMSYVDIEEDDGVDRAIDAEHVLRRSVGRVEHDLR